MKTTCPTCDFCKREKEVKTSNLRLIYPSFNYMGTMSFAVEKLFVLCKECTVALSRLGYDSIALKHAVESLRKENEACQAKHDGT